ncbi:MAG: NAD(P)/FAD-dependent oxidoreductase [Anaerolineales bacterium]
MTDYDTIVIGSGAGGLTAAVALARARQRVLLLEQHEVPGGWMHSFTLDGYRFNTGVHYVGELGPGERLRRIYEGLGVADDLAFTELNPAGYDHILIGDRRFDIPKGRDAYVARLKEAFPEERGNIDRFFDASTDIFWLLQRMIDEEWQMLLKRPRSLPWFARSGGDLIDHYVEDRTLRAVLKGQSGAHGMAPKRVSAAIHTAVMHHYLTGAYHPVGGGMAIARACVRALKRAGGELRLEAPVRRVLIEGKRAVGVELAGGERITAASVISNADPHGTFARLIGRDRLSRRLRRMLDRVGYSTSCLSLYLAMECVPRALGMDSGNYYIHAHDDIDGIFERAGTRRSILEDPELVFVSVTSLKDPTKHRRNGHQMEIFGFTGYQPFAPWADQPSGDRDAGYQRLKQDISRRMIEFVDRRFPGVKDSVIFQELGTPLTNHHYVRVHLGNIYGIDKGVWQAGPLGFRTRTEFENLYLCGASTMAHGVAYASNSGLIAAGKVLGCRPESLLTETGASLRIYQAEDPSTWPEQFRPVAAHPRTAVKALA